MFTLLLLFAPQDVESVLAEMDKANAKVDTFIANYKQVKRLSLMDDESHTSGRVYFRRNARAIRLEEKDSGIVKQLEGDRYVAVYPKLREVEVQTLDQRGRQFGTIMGAPDGSKNLKQDFQITMGARRSGEIELKLAPLSEDVKKYVKEAAIRLSSTTHLLTAVSFVETNGDAVEISFLDMKTNEPIAPKTFVLDIDALTKSGYTLTRR